MAIVSSPGRSAVQGNVQKEELRFPAESREVLRERASQEQRDAETVATTAQTQYEPGKPAPYVSPTGRVRPVLS